MPAMRRGVPLYFAMSAFKDGRYPISLDQERHLLFSLNAMDEMQDKFGDLGELDKVMSGKDRFKAVRWLLCLLLNEGAAEGEALLTEKEVGKMIHAGNMAYAQKCIYKSIAIGQNGTEETTAELDDSDEDDETEQGNAAAGQEQ